MKWLRNYFGFSKTETYGIVVIHLAIGLMIILPIILEFFLDGVRADAEIVKVDTQAEAVKSRPFTAVEQDSLFEFNPNHATADEFRSLGLPEFLTRRIINFRSKGGNFRVAEDLYRIYGIDSVWVDKIKPFVTIPRLKIKPSKQAPETINLKSKEKILAGTPADPAKESPIVLDLNSADTTQLKAVRGIGPVLSNRIIRFREKLGGFVTLDQLGEVYGISPEVMELLKQRFTIGPEFIPRRIKINECTVDELQSHPYISRKTAEIIINYRSNHFPLKPDDLEHFSSIAGNELTKLRPYLTFE